MSKYVIVPKVRDTYAVYDKLYAEGEPWNSQVEMEAYDKGQIDVLLWALKSNKLSTSTFKHMKSEGGGRKFGFALAGWNIKNGTITYSD